MRDVPAPEPVPEKKKRPPRKKEKKQQVPPLETTIENEPQGESVTRNGSAENDKADRIRVTGEEKPTLSAGGEADVSPIIKNHTNPPAKEENVEQNRSFPRSTTQNTAPLAPAPK